MGQSYYLVKPLSGEFRELSPPFPDFDPQGGGLNSKGVLNSPKLTQKVKFLAPRAFDARQKPHFWTFWRSALRADHPKHSQKFLGAFGADFCEKKPILRIGSARGEA